MKSDHQIRVRASGFRHNMAAWCEEKSHRIVRSLAEMVELLSATPDLPEDVARRSRVELSHALWNSTKLLSFFRGAEWSTEDARRVMDGGVQGYEQLAVSYGLIPDPAEETRARFAEFTSEALAALDLGRSDGRQAIQALLLGAPKDPRVEQIRDATDDLAMGNTSWEDYVSLLRRLLT